jgi:uncharacterized membrane protein (UPF0127 family)
MPCQLLRADGSRQPLALEQAARLWPRLKGLLGRHTLAPATGIWLKPCNSVHCFFMRFSIDVLYLDATQHIIAIRTDLKPWQLSLCWPAKSVVELAGGECQRLRITIGDQIQCES